ncbi:hypothetical protein GDO78_017709 [Eleutherodactylus coqui]|uniref:Uncharacterized protein n=1 Tax=Eleutherodactylus coqui TaxID=57060 RepID=A0A8J6BLF5_ELECQ|nr:hypothetical protein GDO78_017709 [Eleutherodactylus coqui]
MIKNMLIKFIFQSTDDSLSERWVIHNMVIIDVDHMKTHFFNQKFQCKKTITCELKSFTRYWDTLFLFPVFSPFTLPNSMGVVDIIDLHI